METDLQTMMQAAIDAERFPLGSVLCVILVVTLCIAALMVLAWFLFRTRLPRLSPDRRE